MKYRFKKTYTSSAKLRSKLLNARKYIVKPVMVSATRNRATTNHGAQTLFVNKP